MFYYFIWKHKWRIFFPALRPNLRENQRPSNDHRFENVQVTNFLNPSDEKLRKVRTNRNLMLNKKKFALRQCKIVLSLFRETCSESICKRLRLSYWESLSLWLARLKKLVDENHGSFDEFTVKKQVHVANSIACTRMDRKRVGVAACHATATSGREGKWTKIIGTIDGQATITILQLQITRCTCPLGRSWNESDLIRSHRRKPEVDASRRCLRLDELTSEILFFIDVAKNVFQQDLIYGCSSKFLKNYNNYGKLYCKLNSCDK